MSEGMAVKSGTPDGRGRHLRRRLVLGTALATSAFFGGYRGYVRRAYAACTGAGGTYTCSGTTTTTQSLTGTPLTVTTDNTFSIDTTGSGGGDAFTLTSNSGLTFIDDNRSTITGGIYGIDASNGGGGTLSISTTGTVKGTYRGGIAARNYGGTSLTIEAVDVSGGVNGIAARNDGTGALSITTSGKVTGLASYGVGIYADAGTDSTGLTIKAFEVSGGSYGIYVQNEGAGVLSITATGMVKGTSNNGIFAQAGTDSTGLTIEASDVGGGYRGIYAKNEGAGMLSITATGMVKGTSNDAIFALNHGTDLTITAADASGGRYGVYAQNEGTGALSITATGTVGGTGPAGISAINYGTDLTIEAVDVSGGKYGIYAISSGSGAFSLTASGTVTGTTDVGIVAVDFGGGDMTVEAADASGGRSGIFAHNYAAGALSITTSGVVTGMSGNGIEAVNDSGTTDLTVTTGTGSSVTGHTNGIHAINDGTGGLEIEALGDVTGQTEYGISAYNAASAADLTIRSGPDSSVTGNWAGILAKEIGAGAVKIDALGDVTGTIDDGIYALNSPAGLSLTITTGAGGSVTGGDDGIQANNYGSGDLTITASGAVTGQSDDGIDADNEGAGGLVITTSGTITGADLGIDAYNGGDGSLTVTATGDVIGGTGPGIGAINNGGAGNVSVTTAAGTRVSGALGVGAINRGSGTLEITVNGAVSGTAEGGLFAQSYGSDLKITTGADSTVTGATYGIQAVNSGDGPLTITANGDVEGGTGVGIDAHNYGTGLTVEAASVTGGYRGIYARNLGSEALSITATGMVTGTNSDGILAYNVNGTALTIKTAAVSGENSGIAAFNSGSGALSIITTGTVAGTDGNGIFARNYNSGDLTVQTAYISGGYRGVDAVNHGTGALSITATGAVIGTNSDGILASNNNVDATSLTISTIDVTGYRGIYTRNFGNGALSITATGKVIGTSSDAIVAYNDNGTSLTVKAAGVSGANSGIAAFNDGSGMLSISATGTVAGAGGNGVFARNYGTDLTVEAVDVSGAYYGVDAVNYGTGALSITATGVVIGMNNDGILASNNNFDATDLTISAVDVSGYHGIYTRNFGKGALSITATGKVTGTNKDGILAYNVNGTSLTVEAATVSGANSGITAFNYGSDALSITATGTVAGTGWTGIFARNYNSGALTIEAADVSGAYRGVDAVNYGTGALSIVTTGTVEGIGGAGLFARNEGDGALSITTYGAVTGGSGSGIYAVNDSANVASTTIVTVKDGSAVSGVSVGVALASSTGRAEALDNAGSITGLTGVLANGGPATISNAGTITGTVGPAIDLTGTVGGPSTVNQQGGTITSAILLSATADTVNVSGGEIEGNIVGQGSAVTNFALGSGSFSFATPFAITGMAAVTTNSGTVTIAGTIDTDVLTVNDGTMTVGGVVNTPTFELNGGVLSVSSDANLGSGAGALTFDGGTFESTAAFTTARNITLNTGGGTFQTDADLTVASGIAGSGGLTKTGTAALTLNGVNSFTGLTTINGGKLVVGDDSHATASLAGGALVNSGGTLGGIGTVGATTIMAGGVHAPGNSPGTQTINGDYVNHGTLQFEVTPTLSDHVVVNGTVDITGSTLELLMSPATAADWDIINGPYTIIANDGGDAVTGTFVDPVTKNLLFLDEALDYAGGDGNDVTLELTRNDLDFSDVGRTPNQKATAGGIDSLGLGNPLWNWIALQSDEDATRTAFDVLSGEIYASTKSALIEDSHFVRDAVNDRIRSAFGDLSAPPMPVMAYGEGGPRPASPNNLGPVAWGHAYGAWSSFDGDGNAAAMDTSTGGFLAGIDGEIASDIRLGFLTGYSHSTFDVDGRSSSGSSDNYHLGLYAGGRWNTLRLSGGLAYTWHDIETGRSVAFPGFSGSLTGDYSAGTFQVFAEAGYKIGMGAASFVPFANLAYVNLHTEGFTEKGGDAALHVRGETTETTFTTLGIHLASAFDIGGMRATTRGTLGWRHAFGDVTPISTHAFAGGAPFDIAGVPIAKDAALVEAGLDLDITEAATLGIAYQGQFGDGATQNGFKADFSVRF